MASAQSICHAILFRLLVIVTFIIAIPLFTIFIFVLSPFMCLYYAKSYLSTSTDDFPNLAPSLSTSLTNDIERKLIKNRKFLDSTARRDDLNIISDWQSIKIVMPSGAIKAFDIHSIISSDHPDPKKPNLLWLHGVGGTATLSFVLSGILDRLSKYYNVYAFDFPGLGRSNAPEELINGYGDSLEDTLVELLKAYIELKSLGKVYIAAHSGSGFHMINFAYKYPELVDKLLLVDAGGLFPTWGKNTAYMCVLFKYGIPSYQLRHLSSFGTLVAYTLFWLLGTDLLPYYWYQVQSSPSAFGDIVISSYFHLDFLNAYWKRPVFRRFLDIKVPMALLYGEYDHMIEPHQGVMLSTMGGSSVPVFVIEGASHGPMHRRQGEDFSFAVKMAFDNAKSLVAHNWTKNLPMIDGKPLEFNYVSTFSRLETENSTEKLYEDLLFYQHSTMIIDKLKDPTTYFVKGNSATIVPVDKVFPAYQKIRATSMKRYIQSRKSSKE